MQLPKRRSEENNKYAGEIDPQITASALRDLKNDLARLEAGRPAAVAELTRTREMGDLSENAAYSQAKARVAGIDRRILELKDRINLAVVIDLGPDEFGRARVGSTVEVEVMGRRRVYQIVGSTETDPAAGKISRQSPLGAALLGSKPGDKVSVMAATGKEVEYLIVDVR